MQGVSQAVAGTQSPSELLRQHNLSKCEKVVACNWLTYHRQHVGLWLWLWLGLGYDRHTLRLIVWIRTDRYAKERGSPGK